MLKILCHKNKNLKNQDGFTLVELIVVIAILGILVAFIIPKISGFGDSAKKVRVESEHKMLVSAIQMYQSHNGLDATPSFKDLEEYIEGGSEKILRTKNKEGQPAHDLSSTSLVSTWNKGEKDNEWIYNLK